LQQYRRAVNASLAVFKSLQNGLVSRRRRPPDKEMTQIPPTMLFLFFAAASFAVLRAALTNFARDNRASYAAPALIVFGVVSAFIFNQLALHQFFIWHLLIFTLIIFSWHAKSRISDEKLIEMTRASGKDDPDVVQTYGTTRRLLGFGLVSYICAFSAVYYYLYTQNGG